MATFIESRLGLLRVATLWNMTEHSKRVGDFNVKYKHSESADSLADADHYSHIAHCLKGCGEAAKQQQRYHALHLICSLPLCRAFLGGHINVNNINVEVYSLKSPCVQQTLQFISLVLELSLIWSHLLWGEFNTFSAANAIHNFSSFHSARYPSLLGGQRQYGMRGFAQHLYTLINFSDLMGTG